MIYNILLVLYNIEIFQLFLILQEDMLLCCNKVTSNCDTLVVANGYYLRGSLNLMMWAMVTI
jgi:hypothetical protein